MKWSPATADEVKQAVSEGLAEFDCSDFRALLVPQFKCRIKRTDRWEDVFVVAAKGDQVVYFDDVDDEFGTAILQDDTLMECWLHGPLRMSLAALSERS